MTPGILMVSNDCRKSASRNHEFLAEEIPLTCHTVALGIQAARNEIRNFAELITQEIPLAKNENRSSNFCLAF
jgi:hypothetical protein